MHSHTLKVFAKLRGHFYRRSQFFRISEHDGCQRKSWRNRTSCGKAAVFRDTMKGTLFIEFGNNCIYMSFLN